MATVIEYATLKNVCRGRLLLEYFGQENSLECGNCDVCIERKTKPLTDSEFKQIEGLIRGVLTREPVEPLQLVNLVGGEAGKAWKVIKWLQENGVIVNNKDGMLTLHEK